ncbi:IS3 family transposase [Dermacoccus abyssi]|uniref:IS3 family transposase n=1 Tax=Dermacoccus abyssi TaxID=322596 RepID=A0ABX5Z7I8_9MICO|nr:IS3 family transposase [Dermacoccus abyssi]
MPKKYDQDLREHAVRMVLDKRAADGCSQRVAMDAVGASLGIAPATIRNWMPRPGEEPAATGAAKPRESLEEENRRLRRELAETRRANEILKKASAFFRSGTRPPHDEMIRFIDEHRDRFGVEPICRALRATDCGFITSRGYRAAKSRPRCARAIRDDVLVEEVKRLHAQNYGVYGHRKMWYAMRREGWMIGRDQTARLMRTAGLHGVRRGRRPFTTVPSKLPDHRPDLVERDFHALAPNMLWVADITYVRTVSGFAYTAFITDACTRKIVGWSVASSLSTQALPMIALQQAIATTPAARQGGRLVHHSDRGVQYVSLAYTDTLAEHGVAPSVGTVGDSYDNALAETVNGLYKAELIYSRTTWPSTSAVELATLEWVTWWNHQRLHEALGYRTPVEVEASYDQSQTRTLVTT